MVCTSSPDRERELLQVAGLQVLQENRCMCGVLTFGVYIILSPWLRV